LGFYKDAAPKALIDHDESGFHDATSIADQLWEFEIEFKSKRITLTLEKRSK
jgi:hypothetical protein